VRALRELRVQSPDSAFVFATERGGPFTPDAVNRLIKRIGERAFRSGRRAIIAIEGALIFRWPYVLAPRLRFDPAALLNQLRGYQLVAMRTLSKSSPAAPALGLDRLILRL
jgi:hypothetical protein